MRDLPFAMWLQMLIFIGGTWIAENDRAEVRLCSFPSFHCGGHQ
jgi:hypothetical protein